MPTTKEMIEVMQAYEAGSKIEFTYVADCPGRWEEISDPSWNWNENNYRVKKEPRRVYILVFDINGYEYCTSHASKAAADSYMQLLPGSKVVDQFWAKEET